MTPAAEPSAPDSSAPESPAAADSAGPASGPAARLSEADPEGRDLPTTPAALLALLDALGIAAETHRHAPVFTVEQSRFLIDLLPGAHSKNLFLRNKKGEAWLVTCEEERRIDLKALGELLGAGRLSFGSAERLWATLGVRPGSVTPFALVNAKGMAGGAGGGQTGGDQTGGAPLRFVIDAAMLRKTPLNFHPLINTMTTALAPADLLKFVAHCGFDAHIIDLDPAAPTSS